MSKPGAEEPDFNRFRGAARKPISLTQQGLVKVEPLDSASSLPLVVRPALDGVILTDWAKNNRDFINEQLLKYGALLFRGFKINGATGFEELIGAISSELLDYTYGSTPRSLVSGKIYTSTEYPAEQSIPLHNEMAYSTEWPMKIWFFSLTPAERGGETPIADSRRVFSRIDPSIKERFIEKRVMYVRNYGEGLDLSWQSVFRTEDRAEVERFCRRASIQYEWRGGNRLRTRQVCQAAAAHPVTGKMVWFNQAHLFHTSSLDPRVRESLLSLYKEEDLTRNAYYGDGSPIERAILDEIREIYREEAVAFTWQANDLLMLDNMLAAHGRNPYTGTRKVLVGMAEPFKNEIIEPD